MKHIILGCNLHNQFLIEPSDDVCAIADALLGLHAARAKTPAMTLAARFKSCAPTTPSESTRLGGPLIKIPAMRSTLHILPAARAGLVHAATKPMRVKRKLASLSRRGVTEEISMVIARECAARCGEGLVSATTLADFASAELGKFQTAPQRAAATGLVRLAWDLGLLRSVDQSKSWASEDRFFTRIEDDGGSQFGSEEAIRELVYLYVRGYGPVSFNDTLWWTGIQAAEVSLALNTDPRISSFEHAGHRLRLYRATDIECPETNLAETSGFRFLAYEDPMLKGYFDTRFRYATPDILAEIFHPTGEVRSTILLNGKVCGTWEWNSRTGDVSVRLLSNFLRGRHVEQHFKTSLERHIEWLRQHAVIRAE
jgi:hypothetical protein